MGADVATGIKFAVDEANAKGGVDGRKIVLAEGDDESTPDAGRRVAEKLARDGHNLIIGPITSSISLAISQNLARWDAAFIGTISKADKLTQDACSPRFVRTNHSDAMDLAMINEWAKTIPGNNFAIMAADYVWGQDSAKSFEAAVTGQGKKVGTKLFVPLGTKDYAPYIQQLKNAKADAIWVADVSGAIAFTKQAADFGLIPQTNGKIERFHRTLGDGWAYARFYGSEAERRLALPGWLHFYNHHRHHSAIAGTPFDRLKNVPGHHN